MPELSFDLFQTYLICEYFDYLFIRPVFYMIELHE